jgi:hypothetical protein
MLGYSLPLILLTNLIGSASAEVLFKADFEI